MATKGKKVEIYYTSQGTTTGIDASALIFDGKNLAIHTHGKVFKGTDTTYSADSTSGLSLSGTQFSLNVGAKDSTNASSAAGFTSGRFYQVIPDKNNKLGVVVPWEDHNDNTWLPLTSSQAGYVPKASGGADSSKSNTYYFLGYTGSSINWFKLPANAFENSTYTVNNGSFSIFGNGTPVASTSANASGDSSVNIIAGDNITITPNATNKTIQIASKDTNTWNAVSSTVDGYVPKIGTAAASTIATQADEWVLTSTKGGAPSWRALPANAFKNDDTTYSFYNLAFQNASGTTVDTFKPATSPSKTFKAGSANVLISAASNVISIDTKDTTYTDFVKSGSSAAAGLVPKPSTTAGTTKFLREDGTWSVPSYTTIPNNNVTGSGTSGYIAKFSGANTITNGPAFGTGGTFLRNDGSWATPTNTWTAADVNNAGYVPKSVKGYFLHANASTGALEWVANPDTNTWRDIKGNGTSITSTAALNIKPGSGITVSVSGGDITITNSKPDQNHNTDANVSQSDSNANQNSPVLVKNGTGTGTVTSGVIFADGVTINPSTNSLSVSGNLSVTGTASFGNNVTLNTSLLIPAAEQTISDSQPTALSYGKLQSYGTMHIASDTDGSQSEFTILTSGYGAASCTAANGLAIGYDTLKWKNNNIIHAGNISSQNVSYATSAGNADTVDNEHASAFAHVGAHNNLTASGNEFTTASSGFTGDYYWNYRTAGGSNGNITRYRFCDGKGGTLASIVAGTFEGNVTGSAGSVSWGNVSGKPFNWSGQSGQPSWLWGSNDGANYYVWNPSNFSVNYASRAAYLDGHGVNPNNSHPGYGARVFYSWNAGQAYNDSAGYSNGITIGSHPSDQAYGFQIVQNMWDDNTYTRRYNGGWQEWKTLLNNTNYPSYIDGRYLRYEGWWNDGSGQNVDDSLGMTFTYTSHGSPHHWGTTVTFESDRGSSYRLQLHGTGDNYLYFRNRSSDYGGWHSSGWKQILTNQDTYVASDGTNRGIINGTEVASARHLLINGVTWNSDWHWSGQGGQPSWLWGSNDGVNMYVWNPSNFSVNYASSAGSVSWSNVMSGTNANGSFTISNGTLLVRGVTNWCEGIRILPCSNGWTTLILGADSTSGTSANAWSLHTCDGTFYFANNGSSSYTNGLSWTTSGVLSIKASSSTTFSTSVYSNSDRHLKKDISAIKKDSLEELFNISDKLLKQFTYKTSGKTSYGFIAQELEQYIPEAIVESTDHVKSVSYDIAYAKILASIVNEIKKLRGAKE